MNDRYCKTCGSYRWEPCSDCVDGRCTMNCGSAMADVRGILDKAVDEYNHASTFPKLSEAERAGMRSSVRGLMVRLGLYGSFKKRFEITDMEV